MSWLARYYDRLARSGRAVETPRVKRPGASRHAKRRFLEHVGERLPDAAWAEIVKNAQAGTYAKRKPRGRHPRHQRNERSCGRRCPVFDVPILDGRLVLWVPMVINTVEGVVVTVLAPRPGELLASDP